MAGAVHLWHRQSIAGSQASPAEARTNAATHLTSCTVASGLAANSSAAAPETMGVAMDVPLQGQARQEGLGSWAGRAATRLPRTLLRRFGLSQLELQARLPQVNVAGVGAVIG